MATVEEIKITGRKYRVWDAVNNIWKRVSYWTKASDVEFDDGSNAEDKITQLEGTVTEDIAEMSSNIDRDFIKKQQLTFVLSGNDLYITKNY